MDIITIIITQEKSLKGNRLTSLVNKLILVNPGEFFYSLEQLPEEHHHHYQNVTSDLFSPLPGDGILANGLDST